MSKMQEHKGETADYLFSGRDLQEKLGGLMAAPMSRLNSSALSP